ncbi:hypothetical protein J6590_068833, partial [Homalodisca vitripennis]
AWSLFCGSWAWFSPVLFFILSGYSIECLFMVFGLFNDFFLFFFFCYLSSFWIILATSLFLQLKLGD